MVTSGYHPVVAVKNALVGEYNGRTLSTGVPGCMIGTPRALPASQLSRHQAAGALALSSTGAPKGPMRACLACAEPTGGALPRIFAASAVGATSILIDPPDVPEASMMRQW